MTTEKVTQKVTVTLKTAEVTAVEQAVAEMFAPVESAALIVAETTSPMGSVLTSEVVFIAGDFNDYREWKYRLNKVFGGLGDVEKAWSLLKWRVKQDLDLVWTPSGTKLGVAKGYHYSGRTQAKNKAWKHVAEALAARFTGQPIDTPYGTQVEALYNAIFAFDLPGHVKEENVSYGKKAVDAENYAEALAAVEEALVAAGFSLEVFGIQSEPNALPITGSPAHQHAMEEAQEAVEAALALLKEQKEKLGIPSLTKYEPLALPESN